MIKGASTFGILTFDRGAGVLEKKQGSSPTRTVLLPAIIYNTSSTELQALKNTFARNATFL
jgi:hypothetical protein